MSVEVTVSVEGEDELARAFGLMSGAVNDWRPYWPDIAAVFYISESARFSSGGFGTWPPLSSGYAAFKAKHYPGQPILVRTGLLRESLTSRTGAGAIYEESALELTLGTNVPYAKYHQTGTSKMPARPPEGLNDTDLRVMQTIALDRFKRYAEQLGFDTKLD
jgi:phage gpG-like protein